MGGRRLLNSKEGGVERWYYLLFKAHNRNPNDQVSWVKLYIRYMAKWEREQKDTEQFFYIDNVSKE